MHVNIYFLSALAGVVALAWEAWQHFRKSHSEDIADIASRIVGPLDKRLVVLETKMDLVISGVAMNSVAVLHHPEPSRERVDYLLDAFRERTLTDDEAAELEGYLETIMKWEEGHEAPFKVFQGEQAAAALLLATMNHVEPGE